MASSARDLLQAGWDALIEAGFCTGEFTAAEQMLGAARERAAGDGDVALEASSMDALGMLAHYRNIGLLMRGRPVAETDVEAEESLFAQALELHREVGDVVGSAQSLFGRGLVFQVLREDWGSAMPYFREALEVADHDTGVDLYTRSEIHRHVGFYYLVEAAQPELAVGQLEVSLSLREQLADVRRIPSGMVALARAELAAGNRERAVALLKRAVAQAHAGRLSEERIQDAENALREAQADAR